MIEVLLGLMGATIVNTGFCPETRMGYYINGGKDIYICGNRYEKSFYGYTGVVMHELGHMFQYEYINRGQRTKKEKEEFAENFKIMYFNQKDKFGKFVLENVKQKKFNK